MSQRHRPRGITAIAILNGFAGFILLLTGLGAAAHISSFDYRSLCELLGTCATSVIRIVGAFVVIFGLVELSTAYGLWYLKQWAWYVQVIIYGIAIAIAIETNSLASLFAPALFLVYFWRKSVRVAFGLRSGWE